MTFPLVTLINKLASRLYKEKEVVATEAEFLNVIGLELTIHFIKSQIHLVRQSL
jgi:hypothetical protein